MILFETTHFVNYHCQLEAFYGLEYGLVRIFSMHWHSAFNSLELTVDGLSIQMDTQSGPSNKQRGLVRTGGAKIDSCPSNIWKPVA